MTEDIIRHVCVDIKYAATHNGQRLFLTANQVNACFFGIKSALWGYWENKSAKRMPQGKPIGHLKRYGVGGFLARCSGAFCPMSITSS
jgi:hypothetical protein